jgi:hypothetical protein
MNGGITMRQSQTTTLPEWKITVRLPGTLREPAREKARRTRRSLNRLITDAVQREVEQPEVVYETERERVRAVLKESGMLMELGPEWDRYTEGVPLLTHEEILKMMAGQRPLSEDVIEMRGEL